MYEHGKTLRAYAQAGEQHGCSGENGAPLCHPAPGLKARWMRFAFAHVFSPMLL